MRHTFKAAVIVAALTATPALSGSLADPILEQELIIAEAKNDSAKVDTLMIALTLATVFAIAGGAF